MSVPLTSEDIDVDAVVDSLDALETVGHAAEAEGELTEATQERPDATEVAACADVWTCAICLDPIQFENLAVVKGCEHTYCVHCILKWSCVKEDQALCPTCKAPFSSLLVNRQLDGSLTDFEVEESAVLLARSVWFQDWLKAQEKNKDLLKYPAFRSAAAAEREIPLEALAHEEWAEDALYQYFEDEFEDDDVEEYYFSSQAGPSRITVGNRRWGPNGYVRSGHRCARPSGGNAPRVPKSAGKAGSGTSSMPKTSSARPGSSGAGGSGSKGQGRRARRNARRNAADAAASVTGFD